MKLLYYFNNANVSKKIDLLIQMSKFKEAVAVNYLQPVASVGR